MRAPRRRRRICVVRRGRGGWRPPAARRGLKSADGNGAAERKNRIDRAPVSSSRAFSDHVRVVWLTPAMDSLFAGPASERRRFLDRFVLAIDPGHGARVGAFERALRQRNRLLEEDRRNAAWLDAIEREAGELGVAIAAARLECVSRLEALIAAERDDLRPFPGRGWRSKAKSRRSSPAARRSTPRTVTERCCATIAAATPPPAAPWSALTLAIFRSGTGPRTRRRPAPRRESKRRCWSDWRSPTLAS